MKQNQKKKNRREQLNYMYLHTCLIFMLIYDFNVYNQAIFQNSHLKPALSSHPPPPYFSKACL